MLTHRVVLMKKLLCTKKLKYCQIMMKTWRKRRKDDIKCEMWPIKGKHIIRKTIKGVFMLCKIETHNEIQEKFLNKFCFYHRILFLSGVICLIEKWTYKINIKYCLVLYIIYRKYHHRACNIINLDNILYSQNTYKLLLYYDNSNSPVSSKFKVFHQCWSVAPAIRHLTV